MHDSRPDSSIAAQTIKEQIQDSNPINAQGDLSHVEYFHDFGSCCILSASVPGESDVKQSGVGSVIRDQVRPGAVLGCVHGLTELRHHVLCGGRVVRIHPESRLQLLDELCMHTT